MLSLASLLVFVHVVANLIWIGSIAAVGLTLGATSPDMRARGAIALGIYRALSVPAFGVSFLTGAVRLALDANFFFVQTHYMHGKLLFALAVIALHHVIGARAKRAAFEDSKQIGNVTVLTAALLVCAAAAAFFVVTKPF